MTAARLSLAAFLATAFLAVPTDLVSCGPFLPSAAFIAKRGPVDPKTDYSRNYVGIVSEDWRTEPLIMAWRYFSGLDLDGTERQRLYPGKQEAVLQKADTPPGSALEVWRTARAIVPGVQPVNSLNTARSISKPDQYIYFENCLDDSFKTAAATLQARAAKWGAAAGETKDWLAAQDIVFSNCSGPAAEPAPAPAKASALLKADRAYQSAAASFYIGNYPQAHDQFLAIAKDAASPWHTNAAYLAARANLRDGTVNASPSKLADAARELASLSTPAAKQLLEFANLRLHRNDRLIALADNLAGPRLGPDPHQLLIDFRFAFNDPETGMPRATKVSTPLTDWLQFWRTPPSPADTLANWRKRQDTPWLVAALSRVDSKDPAVPDLLTAAHRVDLKSPAFPSVAYYAARLSSPSEARTWIDQGLSFKLNDSDYNRFLATRFAHARNFEDFLRDAPRKLSLYTDVSDDPEPITQKFPEKGRYYNQQAFDTDSVSLWNNAVPLTQWLAAAKGKVLPKNLREELAQTGWVRSALSNRTEQAAAFLAVWQELAPASAKPAAPYLASPTPFTTAQILLRNPGFSPVLRDGLGRLGQPNAQDEFRDNWWCAETASKEPLKMPAFLSAQPTNMNRAASEFIPTEIVTYAKAHPDDQSIPELLARSLDVAHYSSCGSTDGGAPSRKAFELLKSRYPKSSWAQKTNYWYK